MQYTLYTIYFVHVLVSIFLILVVLLQQGQGADLAVFGGGSTQAAFGARSATTLLHKLTVGGFILFILTTLTVAILRNQGTADTSVIPEGAAVAVPAGETIEDAATAPPGAVTDPTLAPEEGATPATEPADDGSGDGGSEPPAQDGGA